MICLIYIFYIYIYICRQLLNTYMYIIICIYIFHYVYIYISHMLHGAGIFNKICPNKITQFCR